ncbi:carbohydrate ABC transporter permease [Terrarubrum flagellatum]|uniref:carbohydrate ABC transporter permease n=1 Tax=Terrirubrum flagellatum TaxID=2895980 RepID=UPI00314526CB
MSSPILQRTAIHALLAFASAITVFPLIWMLAAAFTPNDVIMARAFRFWPEQPTLANFTDASSRHPIWMWLANSLMTSAAITLGKLALSLPAGFAFARLEFRGRDALFWIVIATMSFPSVVAILPTYIAVAKLGLFDSYAAMIIPSIPYIGFYVFYFRQAFRALPQDMFEAALIDGCGLWRSFVQIALPNVLPAIAALTVVSFMGAWNIYLWAQLVLEDSARKTLTTGIAMFADIEGTNQAWGPLMATSLLSIAPVLIIFLMAQRFVMEAFAPASADR